MREVHGQLTIRVLCTLVLVASLTLPTWTSTAMRAGAAAVPQSADRAAMSLLSELFAVSEDAGPPLNIDAATAYAAQRGGVGLAVIDRRTGLYLDNGAGAHTPMGSASVVKVLIADELLHRHSLGQIQLGPPEYSRIEAMLIQSEDPAASALYSQFGGVSLIAAALLRHGLSESSPPADPQYWGNTKISAHDVVTLYGNVLDGSLTPADRDYLLGLLRRIAPVASDGFGQSFGLATLDPASPAAVKQGWMCCLDGVRNVHSTAVVGGQDRYVIAILTESSPALPWEYGLTTATEVARLIANVLNPRS
ncbi:MAG: hypothetical protein H0X18_14160 [Geodermatophilaceae bacterium]|nr:hypothetical protein [Geodermatophilaceae bacterium]